MAQCSMTSTTANLRLLASILDISPIRALRVRSISSVNVLTSSSRTFSTCTIADRRDLGISLRRTHYSSERGQGQSKNFSSTTKYSNVDAETASSANADEVSHFSALASSWWDPHGSSRLLHLMNPLRHDFISDCLLSSSHSTDASFKPSRPESRLQDKSCSYLDIGCGGGIFAESAARLPSTSHVTAIDPTPSVLAVAKEHARNDPSLSTKLTYFNTTIEDLPAAHLSDAHQHDDPSISTSSPHHHHPQFNIVTLFEVLEHILHTSPTNNPSTFLRCCTSHLAPGGWFIISTISRHPLSYLTTKLVGEMPIFGLVPPGTHTWSQYIKPDELKNWFEKENKIESAGNERDGRGRSNNGGGVERELGEDAPDDPLSVDQKGRQGEGTEQSARDQEGDVQMQPKWTNMRVRGVAYIPGLGWKWCPEGYGLEGVGNYFFGVRKNF